MNKPYCPEECSRCECTGFIEQGCYTCPDCKGTGYVNGFDEDEETEVIEE